MTVRVTVGCERVLWFGSLLCGRRYGLPLQGLSVLSLRNLGLHSFGQAAQRISSKTVSVLA